ncbi:hypothetical protein K435DRAFT_613914, partial [Dendrothele bispora CBS 962.96]
LRRPSMYIGLETCNMSISRLALPDHLDIFPHVFHPVSSSEPDTVFPYDGNARMTFNGLVSPGEPHVILNNSTSMILQMRVRDHNMERCSLVSTIPTQEALERKNRTLILDPKSVNLEIWKLDSSQGEIDTKTLSWRNRPRRIGFLSNLVVETEHTHQSIEFDCGSAARLLTLEISCPASGCNIDFWQE